MNRISAFVMALALPLASACMALAQPAAPPQTSGPNPLDAVPDKMPNDIPYGAPITVERARAMVDAAAAEAKKRDWKINIAIVDSGGNLVMFERMDGAQLASGAIAQHKARAAVEFRRETKAFETGIQSGATLYQLTLDGVIASRGGIPIVENGKIIGGIGCSGGAGSQDEVIAKAGMAAMK